MSLTRRKALRSVGKSGLRTESRVQTRAGFTLIELLVVITIIGILAALLTVGLFAAFNSGKDFVLNQEIMQVETGLEGFKTKYGTYPPDMQDIDSLPTPLAFNAFVTKAYARADRPAIIAFTAAAFAGSKSIDSAEALVLFLAFTSKDPRYPFRFATVMASDPLAWQSPPNDLDIFFEFPSGSLKDADGDGFPEFIQKGARGAPLVYFDARTYTMPAVMSGTIQVGFANPGYSSTSGDVTPYAQAFNGTVYAFHNPKSFQLICAGQDGEFGVVLESSPQYPVLSPAAAVALPRVSDLDGDNIANFTKMKFDAFLAQ